MKLPDTDKIAAEMYEAAARHNASENKIRGYLGMSEIGHACERKLWLSFRKFSTSSIDGRMVMLFRFGDHVEEDIVHWLNAAGYRVEERQRAFEDFGGWFGGHWDGCVYGITRRPHVLECKSANLKKFKMFKEGGVQKTYPVYYAQAQEYMGYSGLERTLFVIQCKDNSEIYTERIYFDREKFETLKAKANRIIIADRPIDPPFSENSFECTWCDYKALCWAPDRYINTRIDCMTCNYMAWETDFKRMCTHPDHPFEIVQKQGKCPQWRTIF